MKTSGIIMLLGGGFLVYSLLKNKSATSTSTSTTLTNPVYTTQQLSDMTAQTSATDAAIQAAYNAASTQQRANAVANANQFFASQAVGVEFDDTGQWAILNAALNAQNPRTS